MKHYTKPEILFENFAVSTNIASGCEGIVGSPSKDSCGVKTSSGDVIFSDSVSACVFKPTDLGGVEDMWNTYCYHVHIDSANLFNS